MRQARLTAEEGKDGLYHCISRIVGSELLERLKGYYGEESLKAMIFEDALLQGEEAIVPLRTHYLKRMGNISEFEKVLKQGFSSWYNRRHSRRGTLWMERFKSVLVEDSREVRGIMATYIDLNPVRAEMVEDPRNYRHCGYGAAMGGYLSLIVFPYCFLFLAHGKTPRFSRGPG